MHNTSLFQNVKLVTKAIYDLVLTNIKEASLLEQFPRDIEMFILYGLEIPIVRLPVLSLQTTAHYLCTLAKNEALSGEEEVDNRPLYGLLHVGPPSNVIFVQDGLSTPIVNYVLAHEIGHFIADIFLVRQLWMATMPEKMASIQRAFAWENLDGELELAAAVKGLPGRPKTITGRGKAIVQGTSQREIRADLIAREILAPWDIVSKLFDSNKQVMSSLLKQRFGLPKKIAGQYADDLSQCLTKHPDTIDRLFGTLFRGTNQNLPEN
ncbi:MAG: hypothetical protein HS100_04395 [Anaerolineales bacterium]|nr:hypothetical protein [Anaerolineales bacterium]